MAKLQKTITGGKIFVYLGNNADPVVYTAPCGFLERSLSFSRSLNETNIPDCDDPDAPDWIVRNVGSLSMSISGTGVVASSNIEVWMGAFETASSAKVKVEIVFPDKKVTYTGEMQLESVEIAGTNGDTVSLNVSIQSSGEMVKVVTSI